MTWCTKFPKQAIAVTNGQVEGEVLHMLVYVKTGRGLVMIQMEWNVIGLQNIDLSEMNDSWYNLGEKGWPWNFSTSSNRFYLKWITPSYHEPLWTMNHAALFRRDSRWGKQADKLITQPFSGNISAVTFPRRVRVCGGWMFKVSSISWGCLLLRTWGWSLS